MFSRWSQVIVPLALLASLRFAPARSRACTLLRLFMTAAYLVAIALAGLWLIVPWFLAIVYLVIVALETFGIARTLRSVPRWPQRRAEWFGLALNALMAIAFVGLAGTAVRARWPPEEQIVAVEFPLRDGTYFIANGGNSELVSAHIQTLTAPRFRDYRGQSYGVDIVEVNRVGMRARGLVPGNPRAYVIFGAPIHAPCSGVVLRAEDGRPDMPPPQPDREHFLATLFSWSVAAPTSSSATWSEARCESVPASTYKLALLWETSGIRATPTSRTCIFKRSVRPGTTRS